MDLSFTPYFEPTIQQMDRVMLAQQVPPPLNGRPTNAPVPSSKKNQRIEPYPLSQTVRSKKVSSDTFRNIQEMFENHLVGPKGEYMWFWFVMLFVFCVILIGLHVFEISKLDKLLSNQANLILMMHKNT